MKSINILILAPNSGIFLNSKMDGSRNITANLLGNLISTLVVLNMGLCVLMKIHSYINIDQNLLSTSSCGLGSVSNDAQGSQTIHIPKLSRSIIALSAKSKALRENG